MSASQGTSVPGTAVPIPTFTANGFIVPAQSAIVTGLNSDWNAAFGGNLNLAPNTPQGQLIASQAAIIGAANDQMVDLFNQLDPLKATGIVQDAIGEIYFIQRLPAQATGITVTCGGGQGVVIPENAYVVDTSNNVYFNTTQGTIGSNGTVSLIFQAVDTGPIPVPATVTIYSTVPSWDSAAVTSGVIGNNAESTTQFELRRQQSVSGNAQSTLSTIYAAVAAVPDVLELFVIDNPQPTTETIGGVTLPPNSLYVCVAGGYSETAVAQAIYGKKPVGVAYFPGNVSVNVEDPNPVYLVGTPPVYVGPVTPVLFENAIGAPICFSVVIFSPTLNSTVPSNYQTLIQAAIQAAFQGGIPSSPAATIGSIIFSNQPYIAAINALGAWAQVVSIAIGTAGPPSSPISASNVASYTGYISLNAGTPGTSGTALTVSGGVTGTIAVGMAVFGANVLPGTRIVSGSGSSWVVNNNQLVVSTTFANVTANQTAVSMQINWTPTLQNLDINVQLTSTP
jgi:hypothetical protein